MMLFQSFNERALAEKYILKNPRFSATVLFLFGL
jgi:hypothetical protein